MKKAEFLDNSFYANGFRWLYQLLLLNVYFTLTTSPLLIVVSLSALTLANWPFFIGASFTLVPACYSVLKCLDKLMAGKELTGGAYFFFYRQGFKKAASYSAFFSLALVIVVTDVVFISRYPQFKGGLPLLVLMLVLALGLLVNLLYFYVRNPQESQGKLMQIAVFYLLKKWYVSLLNVALLGVLLGALALKPPVGFLILPSLLLAVIYWNCSKLHRGAVHG